MASKNRLGIYTNVRVTPDQAKKPGTYAGEALHFYDEVIFIDMDKLAFVFPRGAKAPAVYHDGEDISDLSMLYIFGSISAAFTRRVMLLIRSLMQNNCPVSDSLDRLTRHGLGKLYETLRAQGIGTGIDAFVTTSYESLERFLSKSENGVFVVKPVVGSMGRGIRKFESKNDLLNYAERYFDRQRESLKLPTLFVEKFIDFANEWRVYVVDGEFVCSYEKIRPENSFIANLHQGGRIVKTNPDDEPALRVFVSKQIFDDLQIGIYGMDIGRGVDGNFYLIEANRGPGWKLVLETTGINFPYEANRIFFKRARKYR